MRNMISSKSILAALLAATLLSSCGWVHWRNSDSKPQQDGGNIDSPGADVTFGNEQRKAKAAEAAKAAMEGGGAQGAPATATGTDVVTVTGTGGAATPGGTEVTNGNGAAAGKAMSSGGDKSASGKGAGSDKAMADAGMKSADGAGAMDKVTLQGDAVFAFGKSDEKGMLPGGRQKLDELADRILAMDKASIGGVTVIGHADRLGSPAGNMAISEKRAATVMNYLVKRGVDAGILQSMGKGDTEPVADCPGAKSKTVVACLAANRRVEVLIGK